MLRTVNNWGYRPVYHCTAASHNCWRHPALRSDQCRLGKMAVRRRTTLGTQEQCNKDRKTTRYYNVSKSPAQSFVHAFSNYYPTLELWNPLWLYFDFKYIIKAGFRFCTWNVFTATFRAHYALSVTPPTVAILNHCSYFHVADAGTPICWAWS